LASVKDECPTVLLDLPLDVQRPIDLAPLLRELMWIVPFSSNGLRLRCRESFAAHGIWFRLSPAGRIRAAGRGLRAGEFRSHALTIALST
jgi:hypothetical protein